MREIRRHVTCEGGMTNLAMEMLKIVEGGSR